MKTYDVPMQENGRVILPVELRRTLGLAKGDRVLIEADGEDVVLTTAKLRRRRAQAMVARYIKPEDGVVDAFLAEKREEARRETEKIADDADDDPAVDGGAGGAGGVPDRDR